MDHRNRWFTFSNSYFPQLCQCLPVYHWVNPSKVFLIHLVHDDHLHIMAWCHVFCNGLPPGPHLAHGNEKTSSPLKQLVKPHPKKSSSWTHEIYNGTQSDFRHSESFWRVCVSQVSSPLFMHLILLNKWVIHHYILSKIVGDPKRHPDSPRSW